MGNRLVANVPNFILPLETYFNELDSSFEFVKSATYCIVKVIPLYDSSLSYSDYVEVLKDQKQLLSPHPSLLPYLEIQFSYNAIFLIRSFIKDTLFDRLSMRPFLSNLEKKWILFQLLHALNDCHERRIYHGDLKLENVLISSWNWVMLTDFAPFKPTYIPYEDPSEYYYFFDTSQRNCCCLAPERFQSGEYPYQEEHILESFSNAGNEKMDLFSLGCIVAELYTEKPLFTLAELLKYRGGDSEYLKSVIKDIKEPFISNFVENMTDRIPDHRKSINKWLEDYRGSFFPEYFYSFLMPYMEQFSSSGLTPDTVILKIHEDFKNSLGLEGQQINPESYEILCPLVLSFVRALEHIETKLKALELLNKFIDWLDGEYVEERILPICVNCLEDVNALTRYCAFKATLHCLKRLEFLETSSSTALFTEYLFPALAKSVRLKDSCQSQLIFSQNLSMLAGLALKLFWFVLKYFQFYKFENSVARWLEKEWESTKSTRSFTRSISFESELNDLQRWVENQLRYLLHSNVDNCVKQIVIQYAFCNLHEFFGRRRALVFLLSHLSTLPNKSRSDWRLRLAFFESLPHLCVSVGRLGADFLRSFLYHGFVDHEETIISAAVDTLTAVIRYSLFRKKEVFEFLEYLAPFLIHPNCSIRDASMRFVNTVREYCSSADFSTYGEKHILPFICPSHLNCDLDVLILRNPIPRTIFMTMMKSGVKEAVRTLASERELTAESTSLGDNNRTLLEKDFFSRRKCIGESEIEAFSRSLGILPSSKTRDTQVVTSDVSLNNSPLLTVSRVPFTTSYFPVSETHFFKSCEYPRCRQSIEKVIAKQKFKLNPRDITNQRKFRSFVCFDEWAPKGHLVHHIHEHTNAIFRIASYNHLLVSADKDSIIKLWDCTRVEKSYIFRSSTTYNKLDMVVGIKDEYTPQRSCIKFVKLDGMCAEYFQLHDGIPMDLKPFGKMVLCVTSTGSVSIFDPREQCACRPSLEMKIPLKCDLPTCLEIFDDQPISIIGTASGYMHLCDLRFGLTVSSFKHPTGACVKRLLQMSSKEIAASFIGNNEVSIWNVFTSSRKSAFWSSPFPPLCVKKASEHYICGMYFVRMNNPVHQRCLVTCSTDARIRVWNVDYPLRSSIFVNSPFDPSDIQATYSDLTIDGVHITKEDCVIKGNTSVTVPFTQPHINIVTDVVVTPFRPSYVVSASADRTLKIWK